MIYQAVNILLTKTLRFKTSMLRSDVCDYSDVYIVVKGTIDLLIDDANENDKAEKTFAFKNNSTFRSYIQMVNHLNIKQKY